MDGSGRLFADSIRNLGSFGAVKRRSPTPPSMPIVRGKAEKVTIRQKSPTSARMPINEGKPDIMRKSPTPPPMPVFEEKTEKEKVQSLSSFRTVRNATTACPPEGPTKSNTCMVSQRRYPDQSETASPKVVKALQNACGTPPSVPQAGFQLRPRHMGHYNTRCNRDMTFSEGRQFRPWGPPPFSNRPPSQPSKPHSPSWSNARRDNMQSGAFQRGCVENNTPAKGNQLWEKKRYSYDRTGIADSSTVPTVEVKEDWEDECTDVEHVRVEATFPKEDTIITEPVTRHNAMGERPCLHNSEPANCKNPLLPLTDVSDKSQGSQNTQNVVTTSAHPLTGGSSSSQNTELTTVTVVTRAWSPNCDANRNRKERPRPRTEPTRKLDASSTFSETSFEKNSENTFKKRKSKKRRKKREMESFTSCKLGVNSKDSQRDQRRKADVVSEINPQENKIPVVRQGMEQGSMKELELDDWNMDHYSLLLTDDLPADKPLQCPEAKPCVTKDSECEIENSEQPSLGSKSSSPSLEHKTPPTSYSTPAAGRDRLCETNPASYSSPAVNLAARAASYMPPAVSSCSPASQESLLPEVEDQGECTDSITASIHCSVLYAASEMESSTSIEPAGSTTSHEMSSVASQYTSPTASVSSEFVHGASRQSCSSPAAHSSSSLLDFSGHVASNDSECSLQSRMLGESSALVEHDSSLRKPTAESLSAENYSSEADSCQVTSSDASFVFLENQNLKRSVPHVNQSAGDRLESGLLSVCSSITSSKYEQDTELKIPKLDSRLRLDVLPTRKMPDRFSEPGDLASRHPTEQLLQTGWATWPRSVERCVRHRDHDVINVSKHTSPTADSSEAVTEYDTCSSKFAESMEKVIGNYGKGIHLQSDKYENLLVTKNEVCSEASPEPDHVRGQNNQQLDSVASGSSDKGIVASENDCDYLGIGNVVLFDIGTQEKCDKTEKDACASNPSVIGDLEAYKRDDVDSSNCTSSSEFDVAVFSQESDCDVSSVSSVSSAIDHAESTDRMGREMLQVQWRWHGPRGSPQWMNPRGYPARGSYMRGRPRNSPRLVEQHDSLDYLDKFPSNDPTDGPDMSERSVAYDAHPASGCGDHCRSPHLRWLFPPPCYVYSYVNPRLWPWPDHQHVPCDCDHPAGDGNQGSWEDMMSPLHISVPWNYTYPPPTFPGNYSPREKYPGQGCFGNYPCCGNSAGPPGFRGMYNAPGMLPPPGIHGNPATHGEETSGPRGSPHLANIEEHHEHGICPHRDPYNHNGGTPSQPTINVPSSSGSRACSAEFLRSRRNISSRSQSANSAKKRLNWGRRSGSVEPQPEFTAERCRGSSPFDDHRVLAGNLGARARRRMPAVFIPQSKPTENGDHLESQPCHVAQWGGHDNQKHHPVASAIAPTYNPERAKRDTLVRFPPLYRNSPELPDSKQVCNYWSCMHQVAFI